MLADKDSLSDIGAYAGTQDLNWAMSNALSQSTILANLAPVSGTWFGAWLDQWGYWHLAPLRGVEIDVSNAVAVEQTIMTFHDM